MHARPPVPVAIVMIALNEAHNMPAVLDNVRGWAQELFLVDSYSIDETVDIALKSGVRVVQRRFRGFGDQWNFAINALPITAPWTMKLDPDERLTPELKSAIRAAIERDDADAMIVHRRLWFRGRSLPIRQDLVRLWRTGTCKFSDVLVNEHPLVNGRMVALGGDLEHHDSPHLHHWWDKQNRYTTAEALMAFRNARLPAQPKFFGTVLERRMWLKANFRKLPFRYKLLLLHTFLVQGAWRAGRPGFVWARLRVEVHRMIDLKLEEMRLLGRVYDLPKTCRGLADPRVSQCD
jgi:glycosyltransferase involved in cell wall biosynthesis